MRNKHIVKYFGWSLPHQAPPGGFVDRAEAGS
jgi:hypothetical protein